MAPLYWYHAWSVRGRNDVVHESRHRMHKQTNTRIHKGYDYIKLYESKIIYIIQDVLNYKNNPVGCSKTSIPSRPVEHT